MPAVTSPAALAAFPASSLACRTWPPTPSSIMPSARTSPTPPGVSALASRSLILHNIPSVHTEASLREQLGAFGDVLTTSGPSHGTFLASFFSVRAAEEARKHLNATTPPTSLLHSLAPADPLFTHGTVVMSNAADSSVLARMLAQAGLTRAAVRSARSIYPNLFAVELWDSRDASKLVSISPTCVPASSPLPADDLDADLDNVLSDAEADLDAAWPALLRDEASPGSASRSGPFVFKPTEQPPEPPRLDLLGRSPSSSLPSSVSGVSAAAAVANAARSQGRSTDGSPPFSPVTMPRFAPSDEVFSQTLSLSSSVPLDLRSAPPTFGRSPSITSPRMEPSAPSLFGRDGAQPGQRSPVGQPHRSDHPGVASGDPFSPFPRQGVRVDGVDVINGMGVQGFSPFRSYDTLPVQRLAAVPGVHPMSENGVRGPAAAVPAHIGAQAHSMDGMSPMHVLHGRDASHVMTAAPANPARAQVPVSVATTFASLVQSRTPQGNSQAGYGNRRDSPPPTRPRSTPTTPRRCGGAGVGAGHNSSNSPNPKFVLLIEKVKSGGDTRTALMIRNIPNKYSAKMLQAALEENHKGKFDFLYLPIDFKNKCNVGYAFINFTNAKHIVPFYNEFHGRKWGKFNSDKICEITYARIQGKQQLVNHFSNSSLMNEDPKCRPVVFGADGKQEDFPVGMHVRTRRGPSARDASAAKAGGDHGFGSPSFSPGRHRGRCH